MQNFRRFFSFLEVAITDNFFPFFFVAYIFCLHPSNSRLPPHFHLSPLFFLFLFFFFFLLFFFFFSFFSLSFSSSLEAPFSTAPFLCFCPFFSAHIHGFTSAHLHSSLFQSIFPHFQVFFYFFTYHYVLRKHHVS